MKRLLVRVTAPAFEPARDELEKFKSQLSQEIICDQFVELSHMPFEVTVVADVREPKEAIVAIASSLKGLGMNAGELEISAAEVSIEDSDFENPPFYEKTLMIESVLSGEAWQVTQKKFIGILDLYGSKTKGSILTGNAQVEGAPLTSEQINLIETEVRKVLPVENVIKIQSGAIADSAVRIILQPLFKVDEAGILGAVDTILERHKIKLAYRNLSVSEDEA